MKLILFLISIVGIHSFALGQTIFAQPTDGTDCSNLFFRALTEEDVSNVTNLISNDFMLVGFQGKTLNGAFLQQAISEGYLVIESGILTGVSTRNYGDVAVTTGLWSVSARLQNHQYQGDLSYMTVCVRSGGRWKVVAAQLTPNQ
jgi:ketosteroid isomerase-like protein